MSSKIKYFFNNTLGGFVVTLSFVLIFGTIVGSTFLTKYYNNITTEHEIEYYATPAIVEQIDQYYDDEFMLQLEEITDWIYEWDYKDEGDAKTYIVTVYVWGNTPVVADKWICRLWYRKVKGTGFSHSHYEISDTNVIRLDTGNQS